MPLPNLELIEVNSRTKRCDDDELSTTHGVIYQATSNAFQKYEESLEGLEQQRNLKSSHRRINAHPSMPIPAAVIDLYISQSSESKATFTLCFGCSRLLPYIKILG